MTTLEFLAAKLDEVERELSGAILNRSRWTALCEDRKLLVFLEARSHAPDFSGMAWELERIAAGQATVPGIDGPRRKASNFLRVWAAQIHALDSATGRSA
jgi:hypothetical protein